MNIARPAEDFWGWRFQLALMAKMHPDAWFDLQNAIRADCSEIKCSSSLQNRIAYGLRHVKKVVGADDIFFAGLDQNMAPLLYACKDGPQDTMMRTEVFDPNQFSVEDSAVYSDATRLVVECGGPVEFTPHNPYAGDIPQRVRQLKGDKVLTVVPVYGHFKINYSDKENCLLGAIGFVRPMISKPLTETTWMQVFHLISEEFDWPLMQALLNYPCKPHYHLIPNDAAPVMASWQDGVKHLSRESLDDGVNTSEIQTLDHALAWLRNAVSSCGFSDSHRMQPDALLHSIEKSVSRDEADAVSRSASKSASDISKTASTSDWKETADNILNAMGAIFEQTPAIYFATVNHGQDDEAKLPDEFNVIHSKTTPVPENAEIKALQALAYWVGLTGEALYLSPTDDCNKILQLIRESTTQKMPIFAIPIYGWPHPTSVGPAVTRYTGLHGVFIGFRRVTAKQPSLASWLTWVYTAQHMLSPIQVASRHRRFRYRPINIDRSQAKAAAPDEALLLSWEHCSAWRKSRPVE